MKAKAAAAGRAKPRPLPTAWTGITEPDCSMCSWSQHNGVREIKYASMACGVHRMAVLAPERGGEGR
jgi:hypothetical protein